MQQYKEVRRVARVGERIRIVHALFEINKELEGEEFTVEYVNSDGDATVKELVGSFYLCEYVVLEPIDEKDDTSLSDAELIDVVIRLTKAVVDLEKTVRTLQKAEECDE